MITGSRCPSSERGCSHSRCDVLREAGSERLEEGGFFRRICDSIPLFFKRLFD